LALCSRQQNGLSLQLVRFPEGQTALCKLWRMQQDEFTENSEEIDAHWHVVSMAEICDGLMQVYLIEKYY
jgi:hypothetical protein